MCGLLLATGQTAFADTKRWGPVKPYDSSQSFCPSPTYLVLDAPSTVLSSLKVSAPGTGNQTMVVSISVPDGKGPYVFLAGDYEEPMSFEPGQTYHFTLNASCGDGSATVMSDEGYVWRVNQEFLLKYDTSSAVTHTLTFDLNGAPGSTPASQTLDESALPTKPQDPTWDNHSFLGWYTDPTAGDAFDFTKPLTGDTTVYAHWSEMGATIACAPQTGDPAANVWQVTTFLIGGLMVGLAAVTLRMQWRIRRRI